MNRPSGLKSPTKSDPESPWSASSPQVESRASSRTSSREREPTVYVNVVVRIRPALAEDEMTLKQKAPVLENVVETGLTVVTPNNKKKFTFDRVFAESTKQDQVFSYLESCIASLIKGYNVSIMAYGQSGSGKSYTMGTGDPKTAEDPLIMGIVPRAAGALFHELTSGISSAASSSTPSLNSFLPASPSPLSRQSKIKTPTTHFRHKKMGSINIPSSTSLSTPARMTDMTTTQSMPPEQKSWVMTVSYLEIYNEQFRDLLNPNSPSKLTIREDVRGNISVSGLKETVVESVDHLLQCLRNGSAVRQTNSTAINSQSSRSHAIFTIYLTQNHTNPDTGILTTVTSKLNLVDLAGSERIKNSGVNDGRIKEGISINSGLTALGKVISQLSSPTPVHVSYRDSKLTRVLQDSLGGKAITYLIACITTEALYLSETLSTLTYAQRARAIQVTPEIQQIESSADMTITIANLKREVQFWKAKAESRSPSLSSSEFEPMASPTTASRESSVATNIGSPFVSTESTIERVNRSTAFHTAVETTIAEYEDTIASLQEALRMAQDTNQETTEALRIAQETNQETVLLLRDAQDNLITSRRTNQELTDHINMLHDQLNEYNKENINAVGSPQFNDLEGELEDLKGQLNVFRKEQRRHDSETQYLTAQYNSIRHEAEVLKQQNKRLLQKLKALAEGDFPTEWLEQSSQGAPNNTMILNKVVPTRSFFGRASAA